METRENASLLLKSIDIQTYNGGAYRNFLNYNQVDTVNIGNVAIDPPLDNTVGYIDSLGQYLIFKNVNLKAVLGDMYEKYSRFNIRLSSYALRLNNSVTISDSAYLVYMSGLNWANQTYNHVLNSHQSPETPIACLQLLTNGTTGTVHNISTTSTFVKSNPVVDITLELKNSSGTSIGTRKEKSAGVLFGHHTFVFDIFGVDGYETDDYLRQIQTKYAVSRDFNKNKNLNTPFHL